MPVSPPIASRTNGQTIDQTWFNILKTAADDHEDRIAILENEIFLIPMLWAGPYGHVTLPYTTQMYTVAHVDLIILDVEITHITVGSAGTLTVDIETNQAGSFASIMTTKPSLAFNAGNFAKSTNGAVDATLDEVDAGKIIRAEIEGVQTDGAGFFVSITAQRNA